MFKLSDYSPVESCYFWCGPEEGVWVSKALAAGFVFLPAPHFAELKEIIKKKNATLKALFHHLISLVPPIVALVLTAASNSSLMAF